jgi:GNAT superfamily N-acetyltransferase
MNIEREVIAERRRETYAFLVTNVGDDSLFGLLAENDGFPALLLTAREGDSIKGAIYLSPDVETLSGQNAEGIPATVREHAVRTIWALHGIAVAPDARRTGIATALVEESEALARSFGAELITGVSTTGPDADEFYRARGFDVGLLEGHLIFRFGGMYKLLIKQDAPHARWFWKRLVEGGASAFSPSARQLELYARLTDTQV